MKKVLFLPLLTVISLIINAQVPRGFNYQAIVRSTDGVVLQNKTLMVTVAIKTAPTGGAVVWEEYHNVTSNQFGLVSFAVGSGTYVSGTVASFDLIDWKEQPLYLKTTVEYPVGTVTEMGTAPILSVPYSLVAKDVEGPVGKLDIRGSESSVDSALFEVKNKGGQTVFAVYPEGVRVYVADGAKGKKGGFAVGSFGEGKAESQKYLVVSKDSIRMYLDSNPLTKARKGGFAVGGYDMSKGLVQNYLDVSEDSVRIYIDNNPLTKSRKGGFAVGSYDMSKNGIQNFFNIEIDTTGKIFPSQNRILWYPQKNAFMTGKVLIEKPDSVGVNSFATGYESKAIGDWSQALGYRAIARSTYSTAIGRNAIADSPSSFAFGNSALAMNESSFAFGTGAKASGINSYAFGSIGIDTLGNPTGQKTISSGNNSIAIGMGSQSTNLGAFSFGIGNIASGEFSLALGYESKSPADYGIAMGRWSTALEGFSVAIGDSALATGNASVAIGKKVKALGSGCLTLGNYSQSWGYSSIAIGTNASSKAWAISIGGFTSASGFWSTAIGYKTSATGLYSNAFGRETLASGENSFAFGYQSKASGNYSFSFGYQSESKSSVAVAMGSNAISSGYSSFSLGSNTLASGSYSTAMGYSTVSSNLYSFSGGNSSVASGWSSVALGDHTISSGNSSTALGSLTTAIGEATTSLGSNTKASGWNSVAMGLNTTSQSFCSLVLGQYNSILGSTWQWVPTDPIFVIGNGTSSSAPSDAFTVLKNGNVGIGTAFPSTKLDIAGGNNWDLVNGDGDLRIGNSSYKVKIGVALDGGGAGAVGIMQYGQTGGYNVLSLGAQGNFQLFVNGSTQRVGIGTDNPGYKLSVNGTAYCTSGAWTGSDIRWKKNISVLNNTLSGILSLQAVNYDLRTDEFPEMGFESGTQIGLIAQDVEKIFPLLVNTDNNGFKAVAYDKLSVVIVEAIKEQQQIIEFQQKEIAELKTLINSLIAGQTVQMNK